MMMNNALRELALKNGEYRRTTGEFILTETDMCRFMNQVRDKLTDDILVWYNASKKAEVAGDPYWKGYQDAIEDVIESVFDQTQFESL